MDVVYAKTSGNVMTPDGGQHTVIGGQHWSASDPVVRQAPHLFTTDPRYGLAFSVPPPEMAQPPDEPVEQATAAPGERRAQVRRG